MILIIRKPAHRGYFENSDSASDQSGSPDGSLKRRPPAAKESTSD